MRLLLLGNRNELRGDAATNFTRLPLTSSASAPPFALIEKAEERSPGQGVFACDVLIDAMYGRPIATDPHLVPLVRLLIDRGARLDSVTTYEESAYRQLQARRQHAGDQHGPWDYGLALLVDSAAYPPQIGAIHRRGVHLDTEIVGAERWRLRLSKL